MRASVVTFVAIAVTAFASTASAQQTGNPASRSSNDAVDRYARQMIEDHGKSSGQNARVKACAVETLPTVMHHLERAQSVLASLTGAGTRGDSLHPDSTKAAATRSER